MGNSAATNVDSAKDGPQPPGRRGLNRFALALGAVLMLLVALLALIVLVEFRIPLDWARARIESAASPGNRLQIRLRGPLTLITGLQPGLEARDVVLSVQRRSGQVELARLGVARTGIELRALFAREVHLTNARASDLVLRVDAAAFAAAAQEGRTGAPGVPGRRAATSPSGWRFVGVRSLQVERARARFVLPALTHPLEIALESMTLKASRDNRVTIEAQGTAAGEAMRVDYRGGSVADMLLGERAIPMDLRIALTDASFSANGSLDLATRRGDYQVELKGNGSYLERILPSFKSEVGGVNVFSAEGRLLTSPDATSLEEMTLVAGATRAQFTLRQAVENGRRRAHGQFEFAMLDLTPWLPVFAANKSKDAADADVLDAIRALQRTMDVDFHWQAAQLIWPERTAEDVRIVMRVTQDQFEIESGARVLTGSLNAQLRLETAQPEAMLRVDAEGGPIALEALHPDVENAGITGIVRTAKLTARARGASMAALMQSLEGELDLRDADGRYKSGLDATPVRVKIEHAHLTATRDALRGSFEAAIGDMGIALKLSSERAAVQSNHRVVHSAFEVTVKRAHRRGTELRARGALVLEPRNWAVDIKDARLGATRGVGTAKGTWDAKAPMSIHADFARFDTRSMDFFDLGRGARSRKAKRWQDVVVLPRGLRLPAMDLELSVKRLDLDPAQFEDVRATARARSGRLERAQVALRAKGGALNGELSADFIGRVPRLDASVAGKSFDARPLLARFGLKVTHARMKSLEVRATLRGERIRQLVAESTMKISTQGLDLAMPGLADERRTLNLRGAADVASAKGQLSASVSGTLNGRQFRAHSRGPELSALIGRDERVPVDVTLSVADSTLDVRGTVATGPMADLQLRLSGKRVDELLALGGLSTSATGAFSMNTRFRLTPQPRYAFDEIDAQIGESKIAGRFVVDASAKRTTIEAKLSSPTLRQIDIGGGAAKEAVDESRHATQESRAPKWLAPLRRYDATVDLEAERLFAAGEWLGPVRLKARLEAGRLQVDSLEIRSRGGSLVARGSIDALPESSVPKYALHADLKQFNLTPLVHLVQSEAKGGTAILDARAVLTSRGLGKAIVENLDGTLDMATYGRDVSAGRLSDMGINLLSIVGRTLEPDAQSTVNCVVGVFDLGKGLMRSRALFADTTRMRLIGNLDIDLRSNVLDGALRPFPKNPAFFRISTPVDISGTIAAPRVSLATSALPELILRYSNPYTIFLGTLAETRSSKPDGSDDCRAAYAKAESARKDPSSEKPNADGGAESPLQRLEDVVIPGREQQ